MTEENYRYRTSQAMLRNQFPGRGEFQIPVIPRPYFSAQELENLLFIAFDQTDKLDVNHTDRIVHFFLYDYKFERVWDKPDQSIERMRPYLAVLSPDFSMYLEMNRTIQLYNTFRNRWCGAYFASKGLRVVPTVSWGNENTFDFCFEGIEYGSPVAVSTYMVSAHGNHADQKEFFLLGYREMLRRINPAVVLCYHTPFPEMEGNIIPISFELSSWRHLNDQTKALLPESEMASYKIGGGDTCAYDTMEPYLVFAGTGSAHGGRWRPNPKKPRDQRFTGNPGQVKTTYTSRGDVYKTLIGNDGWAIREMHYTDHGYPSYHDDPHGHYIEYNEETGFPELSESINGIGEEFLVIEGVGKRMDHYKFDTCTAEDLSFETISEFKRCMKQGGEVAFRWAGVDYCVFGHMKKSPDAPRQMLIARAGNIPAEDRHEKWGDTADDILEYYVGNDRLRDVITKVEVIDRTI